MKLNPCRIDPVNIQPLLAGELALKAINRLARVRIGWGSTLNIDIRVLTLRIGEAPGKRVLADEKSSRRVTPSW